MHFLHHLNPVFLLLNLLSPNALWAQGVKISGTPGNPNPSAVLEAEANNKGVLVPRVDLQNYTDGLTINNPATGLLVLNTGFSLTPAGFYYNAGTPQNPTWALMLPNPANSDLDMANFNIVNLAPPVNPNDAASKDYVDQAVVSGSGSGANQYPSAITDQRGPSDLGTAVRDCNSLSQGGHSDWYMPSMDELIYVISKGGVAVPNASSPQYLWTRTASNVSNGQYYCYYMLTGDMTDYAGSSIIYYRCVR